MTILPARLSRGDTIGIISPSSPFPAWFPRRFARAIHNLESKGDKVKLAPNVRDKQGRKAGQKENRLADIHAKYKDNSIKIIMITLGGYNSNQLINDIDYYLIRSNLDG